MRVPQSYLRASGWERNRWKLASFVTTLILVFLTYWGPGEDFYWKRKIVLLLNKSFQNTNKPLGPVGRGAVLLGLVFSEMSLKRSTFSRISTFCSFLQDDLLSLKVVSVLHHLSIKRAIQVLRINNFEPNCLRRRPSDEVASKVEDYTACTFCACYCPYVQN